MKSVVFATSGTSLGGKRRKFSDMKRIKVESKKEEWEQRELSAYHRSNLLSPQGEGPYLFLGNTTWILELKRSGQWFYWDGKLLIFTPATYEMKLYFHFAGGKWCELG